jgi:plastocyanin
MKRLRTVVILFVLAAFAVGGTALARTVAGTAPSAQAGAADDGPGHHGDDDSGHHGGDDGDHSGHHGDDDDDGDDSGHHGDDDGGTTTSTTTTGATTSQSQSQSQSQSRSSRPAAAVAGKRLIGTVGPGFSIALKTPSGAAVRTLRAGTYIVVVRDRSDEHNFHLRGRGVDKATTVGDATTKTWRIKFAAGTYTYVCDPHASSMRGSLRVV